MAKALRHSGVTTAQMADYLGVSRNTIGNYLSGRTHPNRATLRAWALRTGVDYDWIAGPAAERGERRARGRLVAA